jgi:hypothetical protein
MRVIVGIAVVCAALALSAAAQMGGGVPASVTSPGFGGHPGFGGVPASVNSPGFGTVPRNFGRHGVVTFGHHPRGFAGSRFGGNRLFFRGSVSPFFSTPIVVPFFDYYDDGANSQPQTVINP